MDARELRIGNLLSGSKGEVRRIVGLSLAYYTDSAGNSTLYRDAKPIPLTPEWLEKFGFEKDDGGIYSIGDFCIMGDPNNEWAVILHNSLIPSRICGKATNYPSIKFIHNLQNLYFALIGEELTISEKTVNIES